MFHPKALDAHPAPGQAGALIRRSGCVGGEGTSAVSFGAVHIRPHVTQTPVTCCYERVSVMLYETAIRGLSRHGCWLAREYCHGQRLVSVRLGRPS